MLLIEWNRLERAIGVYTFENKVSFRRAIWLACNEHSSFSANALVLASFSRVVNDEQEKRFNKATCFENYRAVATLAADVAALAPPRPRCRDLYIHWCITQDEFFFPDSGNS